MILRAYKNGKEVELLENSGNIRVVYKCDECGKEKETSYYALKRKDRLDKQYCRSCTIKLKNVVNKRNSTLIQKYGTKNLMEVDSIKKKFVSSNNSTYAKQRVKYEHIQESFKSEGYKLLTENYKNNKQKLEYICNRGHFGTISWNSWDSGRRCNECSIEDSRTSIEYIREQLEKEGYTLLSEEYKNQMIPIKYKCPKGHIGFIRFHHWKSHGHRCASCSKIKSKAELEVYEFVKSLSDDAENSNRVLIKPYELDIVIPSKKLAIEYCGLYWHNDTYKDKNYHLNKLNKCNEVGYNLITIFEDEWINKQEIVKSRLKSIFGKCDRIFARKCNIKEIDYNTCSKFLENNHIQGKDNSSIRLGAFYKDNLVSVMTFGKGSISKGSKCVDGVYELNRFCNVLYFSVVGVASKFVKYFINNYNPYKIFSYADRRWSIGNLYTKLGFNKSHYSEPNYWYIIDYLRFHRFNFRKSVLKDKLEEFDDKLTEYENMINNGYNRIWDCGNIKYELSYIKEN